VTHEDLEQIGKLNEQAALGALHQLTRFVFRKQLTPKEAAKLAWDIGEAFAVETARRLAEAEKE
jgi:hypothetical protein